MATPLRLYTIQLTRWPLVKLRFPYTIVDITDPDHPKPLGAVATREMAERFIRALHQPQPQAPHQGALFTAGDTPHA